MYFKHTAGPVIKMLRCSHLLNGEYKTPEKVTHLSCLTRQGFNVIHKRFLQLFKARMHKWVNFIPL